MKEIILDSLLELLSMVYCNDQSILHKELKAALDQRSKQFIITANPEIITLGSENPNMNRAFHDCTIITADGVGVEKAINWKLKTKCSRNTGIDIATYLLQLGNQTRKTLYLYGASKEVLDDLLDKISKEYPDLKVVGAIDGYNHDFKKIKDDIIKAQPDLLLVAIGAPNQEIFIDSCFREIDHGICIGIGGAFDVLSGHTNRAPEFFVKHNLEWLYRITKEPKRIKRFWKGNILFFVKLAFQK